jgi:hypothetical protein
MIQILRYLSLRPPSLYSKNIQDGQQQNQKQIQIQTQNQNGTAIFGTHIRSSKTSHLVRSEIAYNMLCCITGYSVSMI